MDEIKKKKLQTEAIAQLELLGVKKDVLEGLRKSFRIPVTYISGEMGGIGKVHQKALEAFERRTRNAFPFYIIESFMATCELISIIYIEVDESSWEMDYESIDEMCHYAFVYNKTHPEMSEIGKIGLSIEDNILYRIW